MRKGGPLVVSFRRSKFRGSIAEAGTVLIIKTFKNI